jgi:hypothetical protein
MASLVIIALALLAAGCGGNSSNSASATPKAADPDAGQESTAADKPCSQAGDITGTPKAKVPAGVVFPDGAHVYESQGPFGKTTRFFAAADGGPDDLPKVRDDAAKALEGNGYKLNATDQEEGAEAEAHLARGEHLLDVQVISLCEGKVRIRYTVS